MIRSGVGNVGLLGFEEFKQGSDMTYDSRRLLWLLCEKWVDWRHAMTCKDWSPQASPLHPPGPYVESVTKSVVEWGAPRALWELWGMMSLNQCGGSKEGGKCSNQELHLTNVYGAPPVCQAQFWGEGFSEDQDKAPTVLELIFYWGT